LRAQAKQSRGSKKELDCFRLRCSASADAVVARAPRNDGGGDGRIVLNALSPTLMSMLRFAIAEGA
jgi:hypothetical protein